MVPTATVVRSTMGRKASRGKRKISRPTTVGRSRIRPTNAAAAANLGLHIFVFFRPLQADPYLFSSNFGPSELKDSSPFESYEKKFLVDFWIEFSDHHSNVWTKIRVLICS